MYNHFITVGLVHMQNLFCTSAGITDLKREKNTMQLNQVFIY